MNKNYITNPIIDNKYYVSENKYFDIIKKAENGYKVKDQNDKEYYILTYGWQGYYYKDPDAFKNKEGVCYIPEFAVEETGEPYVLVPMDKNNKSIYTYKDIYTEVNDLLSSDEYDCFFAKKIPEKLIDSITGIVFDTVDWQHPSSYLNETSWDEVIEEFFENNPEEIRKFNILVIEQYTGNYEIEANNYHDAKNILEDKINSGEIILDNTDTYERKYKDITTEYENEVEDGYEYE